MDPGYLRSTPASTRRSHIITLTLPKSKGFLQALNDSASFGASPGVTVGFTRATESTPEPQQEGYSSNPDQGSKGSPSPATSPENGNASTQQSSPPSSPSPLPRKDLNEIRLEAAREAVGIFRSWAREDILDELNEALAIKDASGMEAELLQKAAWVKECLRAKYQVWVQYSEAYTNQGSSRSLRGNKDHEVKICCGYPGCGRVWDNGEIRISFEPPGWTTVEKVKTPCKNKFAFELDRIPEDGGEESIITGKTQEEDSSKEIKRLPDYHILLTSPRHIRLHGHGEFFCLHCFEKLLAPPSATADLNKKRKREDNKQYLRPSPLCRIYGSVFPETRISADGKFQLDTDSENIVGMWKDALFDKGLKNMRERFGELWRGTEEAPMEMDDLELGDGRGLAELLSRKNEEVGRTVKRKK